MTVVRVKDRGRDLAVHALERENEALEIASVYLMLGYPPDKIVVEPPIVEQPEAA